MVVFQKIDVLIVEFLKNNESVTYSILEDFFKVSAATIRNSCKRLLKHKIINLKGWPKIVELEDKDYIINQELVSSREVVHEEEGKRKPRSKPVIQVEEGKGEEIKVPGSKEIKGITVKGKAAEIFYAKLQADERMQINRTGKDNRLIIEISGTDRVYMLIEEEDKDGNIIKSKTAFELNKHETVRHYTFIFN
jgi:hypothetical protein